MRRAVPVGIADAVRQPPPPWVGKLMECTRACVYVHVCVCVCVCVRERERERQREREREREPAEFNSYCCDGLCMCVRVLTIIL